MCTTRLEPEARAVLLKSVPKSLSHLLSQCALSGCLKATCNDGERCRSIDTPKTLPRSAIIVADKVFQWRPPEEDMKGSEEHVRTLVGEIGTGKERKPLDPVLVIAVGQFFYLVDGHHRMDAYHTANWSKPIPVEVFKGSLRDARDEAFSRNYKDKLPMSQEAKSEAAWVRFNEGDLSWSELEERFRVSNGTIARMSKARKALLEANQNPAEVRWRDARSPAPPR